MREWKLSINSATAVTPESLGIRLVDVVFRSHAPGRLALEFASSFDAVPPVVFGDQVSLIRSDDETDVIVFTGRCRTVPTWGYSTDEGFQVEVLDAWAELEETLYEENWNAFEEDEEDGYRPGFAQVTKYVLGVDLTGGMRKTSVAFTDIIGFAATAGVALQMGSVPTGMNLVPREVSNATCAELLRDLLRHHADWMTSIDYTTTPPTLNVTDRATAVAHGFPVDGSGDVQDFSLTRRDDLRPLRVILKMEAVGGIAVGGTPSPYGRSLIVDMYPPAADPGPDPIPTAGPRVMIATVPSPANPGGGGTGNGTPWQIETINSRVKTRAIPQTAGADAKQFLIDHLPQLGALDFTVSGWTPALMAEPADPEAVDEDDPPGVPTTVEEVPRELLSGQIHDWMRVKQGQVGIAWAGSLNGTPTAAQRRLFRGIPKHLAVTGTDAITKKYTKVTNFTPGSPPEGMTPRLQFDQVYGDDGSGKTLAQRYFEMLDQATYTGQVTLVADEISATNPSGGVINLSGGPTPWATMRGLCNSVAWDLQTGKTTIDFGPPRWLTLADFIDLARALRDGRGNPISPSARAGSNASGTATYDPDEKDTDQGYRTANIWPGGTPVPDNGVTGAGQISVTFSDEDELYTVRGNSKDHNVFVYKATETKPAAPQIAFEDGLETKGAVPPDDPTETLIVLPVVRSASGSQVAVEFLEPGIYEVKGNGVDGKLTYTIGAASAVDLVFWEDGLVLTEGIINIPIPESGSGSGLPTGSAGDILYHNGTDWVVLTAPAAPGSGEINLLKHTGTAPAWVTVEEQSLSICSGGSPTTITVLKL